MLYITQLIYINPGQEAILDEFESLAIPIIARYNGRLELRIRPTPDTVIEADMKDLPYEIHLASFPTEDDFQNFLRDETRREFLHLKERAIRTSLLVKGEAL